MYFRLYKEVNLGPSLAILVSFVHALEPSYVKAYKPALTRHLIAPLARPLSLSLSRHPQIILF